MRSGRIDDLIRFFAATVPNQREILKPLSGLDWEGKWGFAREGFSI